MNNFVKQSRGPRPTPDGDEGTVNRNVSNTTIQPASQKPVPNMTSLNIKEMQEAIIALGKKLLTDPSFNPSSKSNTTQLLYSSLDPSKTVSDIMNIGGGGSNTADGNWGKRTTAAIFAIVNLFNNIRIATKNMTGATTHIPDNLYKAYSNINALTQKNKEELSLGITKEVNFIKDDLLPTFEKTINNSPNKPATQAETNVSISGLKNKKDISKLQQMFNDKPVSFTQSLSIKLPGLLYSDLATKEAFINYLNKNNIVYNGQRVAKHPEIIDYILSLIAYNADVQ